LACGVFLTSLAAGLASVPLPVQAAGGAPVPALRASRYFPLAAGNSWTYRYQEAKGKTPRTLRWAVTQEENAVFRLRSTPPDGNGPLALSVAGNGVMEAGTKRFLLEDPLAPLSRWSLESDEFQVVSVNETCSVGQHLFRHCVVIQETDKGSKFDSVTTYVLDLGPVRYVYKNGATLTIRSWHVRRSSG
jgi:hypothetical protein